MTCTVCFPFLRNKLHNFPTKLHNTQLLCVCQDNLHKNVLAGLVFLEMDGKLRKRENVRCGLKRTMGLYGSFMFTSNLSCVTN